MGCPEELSSLFEACGRFGLRSGDSLDVSVLSATGAAARVWTADGGKEVSLAELPPVHRAVHEAAGAAKVVLAVPTAEACSVAKLDCGLRCLSQSGAIFYEAVAVASGAEEVPEALAALKRPVALLAEGRFYALGKDVGAAFVAAFYLQKTCCQQLLVGGRATVEPEAAVWQKAREQMFQCEDFEMGVEWPAVLAALKGEEKFAPIDVEEGEQQLRVALSEAHKKLNKLGLDELIWNHCSAKLSDGAFLITAGDRLWDSMEPETLLRASANNTGNILHTAVYEADAAAKAVVHTHSVPIEAVSCLEAGLSLEKGSAFEGKVAYYPWEGVSDDWEECQRVTAAIKAVPGCVALIMRNHGAITFGGDITEALERHLALDEACRAALQA